MITFVSCLAVLPAQANGQADHIDATSPASSLSFLQRHAEPITLSLSVAVVALLTALIMSRIHVSRLRRESRKSNVLLLENILDNLPIAAKVKDVSNDFRYIFWNKESEIIFECTANEAIGKTDFDVLPEAAEAIREEDERLVENGEPQWGIRRFYNKSNEERFTFQNNNCVTLPDGRKWIVFTAWDVTETKQLERSLKQTKEAAEESNRIKSAFLANMSHEIRTPLNAIVGFSGIMAGTEELTAEERREYSSIIELNNTLLLQLINDMLDLAKIEAGTLEFTYSSVDINKMITETTQAAIRNNHNPAVEIHMEAPLPKLLIYTDQRRLLQVLNNFINNAMKFTNEGSITIGYNLPEGGHIRFFVTDTGIGIPEGKTEEVFNRFVKLNSFKQGTGLGLAISQNIIKDLQGKIGVDSVYGKGSTFWCTLPYDRVDAHKSIMP
ncbi:MAG: PAS domain-containing protein [Prevotellaceae bacterium]|nr:PAS domain-containing protein [Prevotellaceae bacterium]